LQEEGEWKGEEAYSFPIQEAIIQWPDSLSMNGQADKELQMQFIQTKARI